MEDWSDTQKRILDCAADAFMESGYDGASIDDIARRMNQTKGVIYYSFRSKVEIYQAVYERGMRELASVVSEAAAQSGTGRERLTKMVRAHVANMLERPGYHDVMRRGVEQRATMPLTEEQRDRFGSLMGLRAEFECLFVDVLEDGIKDGSLRDLRPRLASRLLIGSVNAVNFWYRYYGPGDEDLTTEQLVDALADLLVSGLTSVPRGAEKPTAASRARAPRASRR
jgi:AcrR family transcriptional regulator